MPLQNRRILTLSSRHEDDAALYPLGERHPDLLLTGTGKPFESLTVESLCAGESSQDDIAISAEALSLQARVARSTGRPQLARNFDRGAELVGVPNHVILEIYELLRPGRASGIDVLLDAAAMLRRDYGAERIATLVEEAARTYESRGLFRRRF